jgi:(p)ppGpp synthase/HD superfamily hydrolase
MSIRIAFAKLFCIVAHGNQKRKYTGEPYFVHPFEVERIVSEYTQDIPTRIGALLHDTVEDTWVKAWMIRLLFGKLSAETVLEVTDVSKPSDGNRKKRKEIDRKHIANGTVRGQTIKCADLISNTKSIVEHDLDFARIYLAEKELLLEVLVKAPMALQDRVEQSLSQSQMHLALMPK